MNLVKLELYDVYSIEFTSHGFLSMRRLHSELYSCFQAFCLQIDEKMVLTFRNSVFLNENTV